MCNYDHGEDLSLILQGNGWGKCPHEDCGIYLTSREISSGKGFCPRCRRPLRVEVVHCLEDVDQTTAQIQGLVVVNLA